MAIILQLLKSWGTQGIAWAMDPKRRKIIILVVVLFFGFMFYGDYRANKARSDYQEELLAQPVTTDSSRTPIVQHQEPSSGTIPAVPNIHTPPAHAPRPTATGNDITDSLQNIIADQWDSIFDLEARIHDLTDTARSQHYRDPRGFQLDLWYAPTPRVFGYTYQPSDTIGYQETIHSSQYLPAVEKYYWAEARVHVYPEAGFGFSVGRQHFGVGADLIQKTWTLSAVLHTTF